MRARAGYLLGLATGVALTIGGNALAGRAELPPISMERLKAVVEIWRRIQAEYVDLVDDNRMAEGCISGMAALDPQSSYLSPSEFRDLSRPQSAIAVVGIELTVRNDQFVIVAPIEGSPAEKAGIESGDVLLSVGGENVAGRSLRDVVEMLRGDKGSETSMSVIGRGQSSPRKVSVRREVIVQPSVRALMLPNEVGYLRISTFNTQASQKVVEALGGLYSADALAGLVIDLRSNPGGTVSSAVEVADVFIREGAVLTIVGRDTEASRVFPATPGGRYEGIPLVVLVDAGTAAGAEILADALRTFAGAKIAGTSTFGRGTIQTIYPLRDDSAIKITTGRWKSASGQILEGHGLVPDIEVATSPAFFNKPAQDPAVIRALSTLAVSKTELSN